MLSRDKTIIILVFIFLQVIACKNNSKYELLEKSKQYIEFSRRYIGVDVYDTVSKDVDDSTTSWAKNNIKYWEGEIIDSTFQVDTLKCFNAQKDKVVTAILAKSMTSDAVMDGIHFFYGVKIKNRWYFFEGATIFLPREMYEKNISVPLSFEKLHEIAMKEIFSGYLIKDEKGNWIINDKFFDELKIGEGGYWFSRCKTQEDYEKRVMEIVNNKWQKK